VKDKPLDFVRRITLFGIASFRQNLRAETRMVVTPDMSAAPVRLDPEPDEQLRNQVLPRDGWRCQLCGTMSNLEVFTIENCTASLAMIQSRT